MRALLLTFVLALSGCYVASEPDYENVTTAATGYELAPGTTMAVVLVANQSSGRHAGTDARSRDESVVKIVPTSLERTAAGETGKVFLLYGVSVGQADIEVFRDGEDVGAITVLVIAQDRT